MKNISSYINFKDRFFKYFKNYNRKINLPSDTFDLSRYNPEIKAYNNLISKDGINIIKKMKKLYALLKKGE